MSKRFLTALAVVGGVMLTTPASALEKASRSLIDDGRGDDWGAWASVTLRYFNTCTGWLWVWSGWANGEALGVCVDGCGPAPGPTNLAATWALTFTPQPSGYGFTGTISVQDRCDCTGNVLASQPWLPIFGFTPHVWNIYVPAAFLIHINWAAPAGFTNGSAIASDHPAVGPTGPQSCGICFPLNRAVHSKYFGVGGAYCPGTVLSDGICAVEFAIDIGLKFCRISVEEASWGQIKSLYQ
ncbi:MAG: hypothetical protein ACT4PE_03425 [Candidatus Eiseniibacteriota bacterium]